MQICIYICFCIFLIFFVAYRPIGVDNDSISYETSFYFFSNLSNMEIWHGGYGISEPGFVFLNKLVHALGGNFRWVLIIMAILTGLLNYIFFFKKCRFPFISLFIYLSFFFIYRDMTQIRYALSGALLFWVGYFYSHRQYKTALTFYILAVLFHNATYILIPILIFIYFFKKNITYLLLPLPCLLLGNYINFFQLLLNSVLSTSHMEIYLGEEGRAGYAISLFGYVLAVGLFFLLKSGKKIAYSEVNGTSYYYKLLSLGISLNLLFIQSAIFQRFSFLLFQFVVMVVPILLINVYTKYAQKSIFVTLYLLICVFLLAYAIRMIHPDLIRPYESALTGI